MSSYTHSFYCEIKMPIKVTCENGQIKREAMPYLLQMHNIPPCPTLLELCSFGNGSLMFNPETAEIKTVVRTRKGACNSGQAGYWKCQYCKETLPKHMYPVGTVSGGYRKCLPCRKAK